MTYKQVLRIIFSTTTGIILIAMLICVLLFSTIIELPKINYNYGLSVQEVDTASTTPICFSAPAIDQNLTSDEEYGAKKSETVSSSVVASIGDIQTSFFDGLDATVELGDVHRSATDFNENDTRLVTATSSNQKVQLFNTAFSNTNEIPFASNGMRNFSTPDGDLRGLATSKCVQPKQDFWFLGGATDVQTSTRLQLVNSANTPAELKISLWGTDNSEGLSDDGSFKYQASRYIGVNAKSTEEILLSSGVPNQKAVAIHLEARSTPVSATISTYSITELTPQGVDFVNPQPLDNGQLMNELVIPGVQVRHDGKLSSILDIFSPDNTNPKVEVEFIPTSGEVIKQTIALTASIVKQTDLNFLSEGDWTVHLKSTNGLSATVEQHISNDIGERELAFLNPAELGHNQLMTISSGASVHVYNSDAQDAKYQVICYTSSNEYVQTKELNVPATSNAAIPATELEEVAVVILVNSKEGSKQQIGVQALWDFNTGYSSISGTPIATQVDYFNFTFGNSLR